MQKASTYYLLFYGLYTVFYKKTKKTVTDRELVVVENNNYLGLFLKGFFLNSINQEEHLTLN